MTDTTWFFTPGIGFTRSPRGETSVEISAEQRLALLLAQAQGQTIVVASNGQPVAQ